MRWLQTVLALALLATAGCGTDEDRYPLVSVKGTITLNDKPLADAQVTFLPDGKNQYNTPGMDVTGPEGNYKLRYKGRTGVAAGKYKVTVTLPAGAGSGEKVPEALTDDPQMYRISKQLPGNQRGTKAATAAAPPPKTEFEAEVTEKDRTFDFDVKAKATETPAQKS